MGILVEIAIDLKILVLGIMILFNRFSTILLVIYFSNWMFIWKHNYEPYIERSDNFSPNLLPFR